MNLLFLGVGKTAEAVARLSVQSCSLVGTTRNANKINNLKNLGIEPILLDHTTELRNLSELATNAFVLVSFPPDGSTDQDLASYMGNAVRLIYISSTSVYGKESGSIDEHSPVDPDFPGAKLRLKAEEIWLRQGAIILRVPAIYGPHSGLHLRLLNNTYRLPGDGRNFTSRIYIQDLARIIMAVFHSALKPGSIHLVGDLEPAMQYDMVFWLCKRLSLPMPASVPLDEVPHTLRSSRQISGQRILQMLGMELDFPTYREGFIECLRELEKL